MATGTSLTRLTPGRAVWAVAWPMVALGWMQTLYLVADAWWVGRLGPAALTALSAGAFGWWILLQLGELGAVGVHAKVAQAVGAGRTGEVHAWLVHGVLVGAVVWAVVAVAASPLADAYVGAIGGDDADVRALTRRWLVVSAWTTLGVTLQALVGGVFRGLGQTRTALAISGVGFVLNVGLDPLFIWGAGPVPAMGIAGAAWATGAAGLVSATLGVLVLRRRGFGGGAVPLEGARVREVVRIGLPITITGVGFSLVYVVLGRMITGIGGPQMAALGVGHRLESFTYLAAMGFSVGASTMVGQHLGAGDVVQARRSVRAAAQVCVAWMVLGSAIGWVGAEPLYAAFTDDPAIVAAGVVYLRYQAAVWWAMGLEMVYEGAFTGAGHTAPAMWIGGGLTLARLPVAWWLAFELGWGIHGVWVAIAGSTLAKGVALKMWFDGGSWEDRRPGPVAPTSV